MTKISIGRLALVLVTALVVAGCGADDSGSTRSDGGEPKSGGQLTILRSSDIDTWDPDMTMLVVTFQTLPLVMEGLVRPGSGGEAVAPGLAESWRMDPQQKTLTFTLRPNLTFSDGTPLTAADVVFSADLWTKGAAMGPLYSAIERAEAADDKTVVLHMKRPSTFTLSWLANGNAVVVPKDFAGKDRKEFFTKPVGAGPFVIDDHRPGQSIVLKRNPKYYDATRPFLDQLTYEVVADPNQQLLRFQSGQADVIEGVPLDVTSQIPTESQKRLHPAATIYNVQLNFRRSPGDDQSFRRAVSLALDRKTFIDAVFGGQAEQPTGFLPPKVEASVGCGCQYEFNQQAAREALAQSAYKSGQDLKLIVNSRDVFATRAGETVKSMLEAVGIKVTLEKQEIQVLIDSQTKGDFDLTLGSLSSVSPTVGDIFSLVVAAESFYSKQSIEVVKQAFDKLDVAQSAADKEAAVREVEKWNHDVLAVIPVAYPDRVYAVADRVHGLELTSFGDYDADKMWID